MTAGAGEDAIRDYYETLLDSWGNLHWWPARTRFEVIVGAYLTQNTSWANVELALRPLRSAGLLNINGIRSLSQPQLESLIRSSGYFRQKAGRLKTFVAFLDGKYHGSLHRMFAQPTEMLRAELLELNGVGPETADSILLYAGQHPSFVVDAYTRRILFRHGLIGETAKYEEIRNLCQRALMPLAQGGRARIPMIRTHPLNSAPSDVAHRPSPISGARRPPLSQIYNQMHALVVGVGKHYCLKSRPDCDHCPLQRFLPALASTCG